MPTVHLPPFDPDVVNLDAPWRGEAACRDQFLEDPVFALKWDSRDRSTIAFKAATAVCETCTVREECVRDAVNDPSAMGNRGGFGFERGTVLAEDADKIERIFGITARKRRGGGARITNNLAEAG